MSLYDFDMSVLLHLLDLFFRRFLFDAGTELYGRTEKKCIGNSPVEIAIQIRAEETLNFHRECAIFDAVCNKFLGRVQ